MDEASALEIVDTHVHFWDPTRFRYPWLEAPSEQELNHPYLPQDLLADADGLNLVGTVHVQAERDHEDDPVLESSWLAEIRHRTPNLTTPTAWIGYADLRSPTLDDVLDRHEAHLPFRGIRQEAWYLEGTTRADILDVNLLSDPRWVAGLHALAERGLIFELLVWPHQLDQAASIFRQVPELSVVVEHLGVPGGDGTDHQTWRTGLKRLAHEVPQSTLKISGVRLFSQMWGSPDLGTAILEALDLFGSARCMTASNYPVDSPVSSYREIWTAFDTCTRELSSHERGDLFAATATRVYRLGPSPSGQL